MPLRILLRPDPLEHARFRDDYKALAEDLEGEGVLVRVLPSADEHFDHTIDSRISGESYDLEIQMGSSAEEIVGTARLVEIVRRRLRGHKGQGVAQRRAKIYLASGEEQEFTFASDE